MKLVIAILVVIAVPIISQTVKHPTRSSVAPRSKLFRRHGVVAWSCTSPGLTAFAYVAGFAVDADGAFRAYNPNDHLGLDTIEHAGRPGNWWALATDTGKTDGHPVLQSGRDPAPGFYVSMTSLFDSKIPNEHDPRRFVDAARIPYVVLPPVGFRYAKLGDFATVVNLRNGRIAEAIVADESAPELPVGEGSIALADLLAIDSNPRSGGVESGVAYVVYSGSGNGEPRSLAEIVANSKRLFSSWGGTQRLKACIQ